MKKIIITCLFILTILFFLSAVVTFGQRAGKVFPNNHISVLTFDNDNEASVYDSKRELNYSLKGNYEYVEGIKGKGLKFDGFRTYASTDKLFFEGIKSCFTVESWIAPATYPWSDCPVIDCFDGVRGFFFGIGSSGQILFRLAAGSRIYELSSDETIPLAGWSHIAAAYSDNDKISIFLNGDEVASMDISGTYVHPGYGSMTIGRTNLSKTWKEFQLTTADTHFYLDAILDEVYITNAVKSSRELLASIASQGDIPAPELSERGLFPKGSAGSFGAFYTKLDYYKEWDDMWRVSDKPDVFVRFDESPVQLVFWRGASFVPCWVSENDIWYTNEWLETWGSDVISCAEPIMDRHCRYSHVRIIENTDARVVVHWRYALSDANYKIAAVTDDGRGEWCDEYHILYPDNVGVRKMELHYSKPERNHDWVEQIVLTSPGIYPDDIIERDAITLVNMEGETGTYTWDENLEVEMPEPQGANISLVNLKSEYKPFIIIPPGPVKTVEGEWESPFFRTYAAHMASGYRQDPVPSVFGWWNHWPVAQVPGDGRWITTPDRPGHFNLTTYVQWNDLEKTDKTRTRIMLQGMTNKKTGELVKIAESWLEPPELVIKSKGYDGGHYDMSEKAYIIEKNIESDSPLNLRIMASPKSPLFNPVILIRNWNSSEADILINNKRPESGTDIRQGIVRKAEYNEFIIWLGIESDSKTDIKIICE